MKGFKRFDESKITDAMRVELSRSADFDPRVSDSARYNIAAAFQEVLRKGLMAGDIVTDIFNKTTLTDSQPSEYPLDVLTPGTEKDFVAYSIPNQGRIPNKYVEGDYVMVPTYGVANAIDWNLKYARDARWDVASRCMEILEMGFTKKRNDDGWHLLLAAAIDRNILVYDSDASVGLFTKRLISLLKTVMRRNGGGNSTSINRFKLTDLFISPEGKEDVRNWNLDQIDEFSRREIFVSKDDGAALMEIFGILLHDIDELGDSQEYQNFYLNDLGGSLGPSSDVELVVGLDLETLDAFKMPVRQEVRILPDNSLERSLKTGYWGTAEWGFAITDNRPVLLGSF